MPAECQWPSFSIAFTVLTAFGYVRYLHWFTNGNWCLHDLGFLVNLQSSHFACNSELVGIEVEVDSVKVLLLV